MVENPPRNELGRIVPELEIQTPLQYAADFASYVKVSRDRAWIQAMDIETGHAQNIILNSLVEAASRGVDTRITMDKFAHTMVNDRIRYLPKLWRCPVFAKTH